MICNAEFCPDHFSVNVSVLAVVFPRQIKNPDNFAWYCQFFKNCWQNTTANTETFTEN